MLLPVDNVIVCAGQEPNKSLHAALAELGIPSHIIGGADIAAELDAKRAIAQGAELAACNLSSDEVPASLPPEPFHFQIGERGRPGNHDEAGQRQRAGQKSDRPDRRDITETDGGVCHRRKVHAVEKFQRMRTGNMPVSGYINSNQAVMPNIHISRICRANTEKIPYSTLRREMKSRRLAIHPEIMERPS